MMGAAHAMAAEMKKDESGAGKKSEPKARESQASSRDASSPIPVALSDSLTDSSLDEDSEAEAGVPSIPVIAVGEQDGEDVEIKAPEIERSLDRAKENLLAYIGERSPNFNRDLIQRAIDFTMLAHKNQFRRSGMPYAEHPFEVAKLLADLNMDSVTIAAGLLHDVVEDTGHSTLEIKEVFGEDVAFLVEAVTKISAIKAKSRADQQAETFRKMLISMAKDIRVIMIKFADRLHNMRTLTYMQEDRKKAIAAETVEVYAPLAHRFGLAKIKWELEDLAFKHLNSDAYKNLVKKVVEKRQEREEYIRGILGPVKEALKKAEVEGKVYGRPKHLYSIWHKMQARQCQFDLRLLRGAGAGAFHLDAAAVPLQGLHRHAQVQHVPEPAHHLDRPRRQARGDPDPHGRDGPHRGAGHRRTLGLQGRRLPQGIGQGEQVAQAVHGMAAGSHRLA
jgi:hypothetical protein